MSAEIRHRVPLPAAKVVIGIVSFAAIGCLLLGLGGGKEVAPAVPKAAWFAAVGVAFIANLLIRQLLGYDIVVDDASVRELRAKGTVIAWSDRPTCTLSTLRANAGPLAKGAAVSAMANAANIRRLTIATGDGRAIHFDLLAGSKVPDAVARYATVKNEVQGNGAL